MAWAKAATYRAQRHWVRELSLPNAFCGWGYAGSEGMAAQWCTRAVGGLGCAWLQRSHLWGLVREAGEQATAGGGCSSVGMVSLRQWPMRSGAPLGARLVCSDVYICTVICRRALVLPTDGVIIVEVGIYT